MSSMPMVVPGFGGGGVPGMGGGSSQRKATDLDFTKYGKHADQMRSAYLSGTFTPPDFDSVPGGGSVAPAPAAAGGGSTTSAAMSPYLEEQIGRYRDRFSVDNTKRAIDKSNLGIMDAAALASKDAKAGQARRGVVGTDVAAAANQKNIFEPAQRAAASAAANITMQREKDLDNLVLGGTGLMTAPDQINLANREFGLRQTEGDREDQRFRASRQDEERRRREEAARWMATVGSLEY